MIPEPPVARLIGASRLYTKGDVSVLALADVTMVVERGEYLAITGPSGSGKSTMLNLLGMLDRPSKGTYWLEGIDTSRLNEWQRAGLRSQRIGFVFQTFHLMPHRTAYENVLVATLYNGMSRETRTRAARDALCRVGLGHRIDFLPSRLSGGEQQRVAIARAVVTRPALLLCDEPTGNLDSSTGERILSLFEELRRDGLTLIMVTHDDLISVHADRVVRLRDGRLETAA